MRPRTTLPRNVIGTSVQKRRTELGWSQSALAAKCQLAGWDVSRSIVAAIEGRVRWVGDFEVVLLATVLGITVADLIPQRVDWDEMGMAGVKQTTRKR
jgi:transcriptional regulator with XRE-family HTH domain